MPSGRSRYVVVSSPVIHNKACLCEVMHCFAGTAMGSGPGGEMPWRYSSPGPRRQTSEWKEEFAGVQRTVVHSFGLPFPTASNIRVMPLLSKAFKTLKRPSEMLAVVGLWES